MSKYTVFIAQEIENAGNRQPKPGQRTKNPAFYVYFSLRTGFRQLFKPDQACHPTCIAMATIGVKTPAVVVCTISSTHNFMDAGS